MMKVLAVTSQVTFVPENYDRLILRLSELPQVGGLLVLKNWESALFFKALGLCAAGAWNTGMQLLKNRVGESNKRRLRTFENKGKSVWFLDTINCDEAINIIEAYGFDMILNARTRFIYRKKILQTPKLGCVNIHHGLLPDQRGTMCDLWSLYHGKPAGFSLHKMSEKIDDGDVISVVKVDSGESKNFSEYLLRSSEVEFEAVKSFLSKVETTGNIESFANVRKENTPHFRNPAFSEIREIKNRGLVI